MYTTLLLTTGILAVAFLIMGVGLLVGKVRLRGSCKGGSGEAGCDVCQNDTSQCVKKTDPFFKPLRNFIGKE